PDPDAGVADPDPDADADGKRKRKSKSKPGGGALRNRRASTPEEDAAFLSAATRAVAEAQLSDSDAVARGLQAALQAEDVETVTVLLHDLLDSVPEIISSSDAAADAWMQIMASSYVNGLADSEAGDETSEPPNQS
ncbi:MAG: hypothetical protein ACPHCN_11845, partial [Mycobacterium sp.]